MTVRIKLFPDGLTLCRVVLSHLHNRILEAVIVPSIVGFGILTDRLFTGLFPRFQLLLLLQVRHQELLVGLVRDFVVQLQVGRRVAMMMVVVVVTVAMPMAVARPRRFAVFDQMVVAVGHHDGVFVVRVNHNREKDRGGGFRRGGAEHVAGRSRESDFRKSVDRR